LTISRAHPSPRLQLRLPSRNLRHRSSLRSQLQAQVFEFLNQTQTQTSAAAPPVLSHAQTQPPQSPPAWQSSPMQSSQPARPNYYSSTPSSTGPISPVRNSFTGGMGAMSPASAGGIRPSGAPTAHAAKPSANFDDLWSLGLGASGKPAPGSNAGATAGKSIKDLEREKAQAGIWGASQGQGQGQGHAAQGGGGAFGSFGGSSSGAGDDLLL